jgi:methylmalonyl-CoA mutase N-terminal domain/subunit
MSPERAASFTTISGGRFERLYTAEDVEPIDYDRDINTRGRFRTTPRIHPTAYRGKLWTMRQFAGFGHAERPTRATRRCWRPAAPA